MSDLLFIPANFPLLQNGSEVKDMPNSRRAVLPGPCSTVMQCSRKIENKKTMPNQFTTFTQTESFLTEKL